MPLFQRSEDKIGLEDRLSSCFLQWDSGIGDYRGHDDAVALDGTIKLIAKV